MIIRLTDRHKEIMRLFIRGLSKREIGEELLLSENTIKTHIKNIYARLGADTVMTMLVKALANDFVDMDYLDCEEGKINEAPEPPNITPAQQHLLEFVAQCWDDERIAEELHQNERTVTNHIFTLCAAFHAKSRAHLVLRAVRTGVIKHSTLRKVV